MEHTSSRDAKHEADVQFYETRKKKELEKFKKLDIEQYKNDLFQPHKLWNMDEINALLGTTTKFWWEDYFGSKFVGKKILDVGCGNCYHVPYWSVSGNDVVGLDSSETSLEILGLLLKKLGCGARLVKGSSEDTVLPEQFDIVNFSNMLHHVTDIPKSLENARKMLKDDGFLVVVEPIYHFPFRWALENDFLKKYNPFVRYFIKKDLFYEEEKASSARQYIECIQAAGFKVLYEKYDANFFGYALSVLNVRNKFIKRVVFEFDRIFTKLVPKKFRSFVYVIASKT